MKKENDYIFIKMEFTDEWGNTSTIQKKMNFIPDIMHPLENIYDTSRGLGIIAGYAVDTVEEYIPEIG